MEGLRDPIRERHQCQVRASASWTGLKLLSLWVSISQPLMFVRRSPQVWPRENIIIKIGGVSDQNWQLENCARALLYWKRRTKSGKYMNKLPKKWIIYREKFVNVWIIIRNLNARADILGPTTPGPARDREGRPRIGGGGQREGEGRGRRRGRGTGLRNRKKACEGMTHKTFIR